MRRRRLGIGLVVAAVLLASCTGGEESPPARLRATGPTVTTPMVEATTSTEAVTTIAAPSTTSVTLPVEVRPPKLTTPTVTVPRVTLPPHPTSAPPLPLPTSSTTEPPLPVPELFDVVQGIGTPCSATTERPDGCWFFVYATLETRTWTHHVYSDAATAPWTARDHGKDCGDEAQPHHRERSGCSFYFGPVHGRTAGQRECFTATTVSGTRESERSKPVCLTWTDHRAPSEPAPSGS